MKRSNLRRLAALAALAGLVLASVFITGGSFEPTQGGVGAARLDSLEAGASASDIRLIPFVANQAAGNSAAVGFFGFYSRYGDAAIAWDAVAKDTLFDANEDAHAPFIPHVAQVCFVADTSLAPIADTLYVIGATTDGTGAVTDPDTSIITFAAADSINTFKMTAEHFLGDIEIKRISTADSARSTNVFLARVWRNDWSGTATDFTVKGLDVQGLANATDADTDVYLMHHTADGWTHAAGGMTLPTHFPAVIASMEDDYGNYDRQFVKINWGYWRNDLDADINADNNVDGIVLMLDTSVNESAEAWGVLAIEEK